METGGRCDELSAGLPPLDSLDTGVRSKDKESNTRFLRVFRPRSRFVPLREGRGS